VTGRRLAAARIAATFASAAPLVAACGGGSTEETPVATIQLSPGAVAVVAGADAPITARVLDAGGRELAGRAVVWTARDAAVADVIGASGLTGVVRGRAPGVTEVAANVEGRFAVVTVTVSPRPVATIAVQPTAVDLRVGGSWQLLVRTLDAVGAELTGRAVAFASSDTTVATVSSGGLVTGVRPGGATVTVTGEQRTALVAVGVTPIPVAAVSVAPPDPSIPVGGTVQLTATARDSAGRALGDRAASWSSSDERVAGVSASGLVTGASAGTARITAVVEGRSAAQTVTVRPRAVASVTLTAPRTTLAPTESMRVTARVADAAGTALENRAVAYASDAPGVATVSAAGEVTAIAPGAATITATSEGVTGTLALRVVPVAVAAVEVTPATAELLVGGAVRLAATPRDARGAALPGRAVTWTSGAPGIARISADGLVTGVAPGVAVVFAESEGTIGPATITVRQVPAQSVVVTPSSAALRVGAAVDLTATVRDAAGGVLADRPLTWTSSDEGVAVVSSRGRVVALRAGTATITATADGGASGRATVTVTAAAALRRPPDDQLPN
jgi:trimeric autotransporter adhesin